MTDQPTRQFVACVFREGDQRSYTYHNDGEPVGPGDRVLVAGRKGGEQAVIVAFITDRAPDFETKPILGMAPPADEAPPAEAINATPLPF